MPSKRFKIAPEDQPPAETNVIYRLALRRPKHGYETSALFDRTASTCPRCDGVIYTRIRFGTRAVLGVTCAECDWFHIYPLKKALPDPGQQLPLFDIRRPPT